MEQPLNPGLGRGSRPETRDAPAERLVSAFADEPEMAELVGLFVSELPARMAALEAAWSAGDGAALRRMAHQLKGSGSGYGFAPVSEAASEVEAAIVGCGGGTAEAALGAVREKVEALVAVCRRAAV